MSRAVAVEPGQRVARVVAERQPYIVSLKLLTTSRSAVLAEFRFAPRLAEQLKPIL
jgi:hypothetical protein